MKPITVQEMMGLLMNENDLTPLYIGFGDRMVPITQNMLRAIANDRGQVSLIEIHVDQPCERAHQPVWPPVVD